MYLAEILLKIASCGSVDQLWKLYTKQMEKFGFDRALYAYSRYWTGKSLGDPNDWLVRSNHPPEYLQTFITQRYYEQAPMLRWTLENDGACSWRHMHDLFAAGALTEPQKRVYEFNIRSGVTVGYSISFRSVSERCKGVLALAARAGSDQDEVDELWAEHGDALIAIGNMTHLKMMALPHQGRRKLTKRQREVLEWVADGKTTQDVATILGLTAATVEKHLRLARINLDVETTVQAVLKASHQNQLYLPDRI